MTLEMRHHWSPPVHCAVVVLVYLLARCPHVDLLRCTGCHRPRGGAWWQLGVLWCPVLRRRRRSEMRASRPCMHVCVSSGQLLVDSPLASTTTHGACVRVVCGGVPQGADIAHILCAEEAAIPIKSFSPEVIVHPVLKTGEYG